MFVHHKSQSIFNNMKKLKKNFKRNKKNESELVVS